MKNIRQLAYFWQRSWALTSCVIPRSRWVKHFSVVVCLSSSGSSAVSSTLVCCQGLPVWVSWVHGMPCSTQGGLSSILVWSLEELNIHPQGNSEICSCSKPGENQNIEPAKEKVCKVSGGSFGFWTWICYQCICRQLRAFLWDSCHVMPSCVQCQVASRCPKH